MGVGLMMALRFARCQFAAPPYYWPYVLALLIGLLLIIALPELSLTIPAAPACSIQRSRSDGFALTADELAFRDELRAFFRDNVAGRYRERMRLGQYPPKDDTVTWQRILNRRKLGRLQLA